MLTTLVASLVLSAPVAEIQVQGEGYLRFAREGRIVYAKAAKLAINKGKLTSATGETMMPAIELPDNAAKLEVTLEGQITAVLPSKQKVNGGQIVLAQFASEGDLRADGSFLVAQSRPKLVVPGDGTAGVIRMVSGNAPVQMNEVPNNIKATSTKPELRAEPTVKKATETKSATPYKGKPVIVFNSENEISADTYRIGDVASIKADAETEKKISELVLGNTPMAGISNKVNRSWVYAVLRRISLSKDDVDIEMPESVTVRKPSQKVTPADFIEAAIAYAKKQVPSNVTFDGHDNGPEYTAPMGKVELRGESFSIQGGAANVTLGIYVDGKRKNSRTIVLDARGADGDPLQKIQAGTRVKIVVRSNGATISIFGKTKSAVFVGQTVEAVSDNRTSHTGILIDPATVEVKL